MKRLGFFSVMLSLLLLPFYVYALNFNNFIRNGWNEFSDQDAEYLINRAGGNSTIDVGDSLRGIININTVNSNGANIGGTTGVAELTGIFQVKLYATVDVNGDGDVNDSGDIYIFGPDPDFYTSLGLPVGSVIALYIDPSNNYASNFNDDTAPTSGPDDLPDPSDRTSDVGVGPYNVEEQFIATATDGTLWGVLGFDNWDPNDPLDVAAGLGIVTTLNFDGGNDILNAFTVTSGTALARANIGLNLIATGPAFPSYLRINRVTPVAFNSNQIYYVNGVADFAINQNLKGVLNLNTPFEITSDTTGTFNATVPEPASILLVGAGLVCAGCLARLHRKRA